jgi:hypothetical protein
MTTWLAGMQDGDGALTSLISTQKLTWYFWGQDRLLNLLPAIAAPFRDPQTNLHVQVFLRAALAFASPVGVICLFRGSWRQSLLVVAATQCLLALALSPYGAFNMWVQHNPCGTSLVLFALAVGLFQAHGAWRRGMAAGALFLAYAVNLALVTWSIPFLAVGFVFRIRERRWLCAFAAANVIALVAAWAHGHWLGEQATTFALHPSFDAMLAGYHSLAAELDLRLMGGLWLVAFAATCIRPSREGVMAVVVAIGMVVAVGALSCLDWLQNNVYNIRYFLTFITVFVSCCIYAIARVLPASALDLRVQSMAALILGLIMFFIGLHGLSAAPFELMATRWREPAKAEARLAIDHRAELIVGDFWDVWPVVMNARSELHDAGRADLPMYGAAFRGHVLRKKLNRLFASSPRGVQALCLQATIEDCAKTASVFGQLNRAVVADASTVHPVQVAGKAVFLVVLRPAG